MNFGFYNIVLIVAVVLLILTLTYIGVKIVYKKDTAVFPPVVSTCPDYWTQTADQGCIIPGAGGKNLPNSTIAANTPGIYIDPVTGNQSIKFTDPKWSKTALSTTCAQQAWANTYGITWDGVTNYNQEC
jgi:hypothetical protein